MPIDASINSSFIGSNNAVNVDNSRTIFSDGRSNFNNDHRSNYKNKADTDIRGANNNVGGTPHDPRMSGSSTPPAMGMPGITPQLAQMMLELLAQRSPYPQGAPDNAPQGSVPQATFTPSPMPQGPPPAGVPLPPSPVFPQATFAPSPPPPFGSFNGASDEYPRSPPPTGPSPPYATLSPLPGLDGISSRASNNPYLNGTYERVVDMDPSLRSSLLSRTPFD